MTAHLNVITDAKLVGYVIFRDALCYDFTLRTVGQLYDYIVAANGIFFRAKRPGLNVLFRVGPDLGIRGLAEMPAECLVRPLTLPPVPASYLEKIRELSIAACVENGAPTEALFHLLWNEGEYRWRLDKPPQEANGGSVRPLDDSPGSSYDLALIELHSHHHMPAFFSGTDDADEQGFRIYAVIGEIFNAPKILVRVGCFGLFHTIPAETVFELPETFTDNYQEEPLVETC